MASSHGLITASIRGGHPDFLDLPWETPIELWGDHPRIEALEVPTSRNPVVFVNYEGVLYAIKSLAVGTAEKEYDVLRELERRRIPAVDAVGHLLTRASGEKRSVLITRFLDNSITYHSLFLKRSMEPYRPHLLDALAGLLVQLHLAGVFWGDCSLFNTLFVRDAGRLRAYLVDAETSEVREALEDRMRAHDLDVMEENSSGALMDLVALGALPEDYSVEAVGEEVRRKYADLWREVSEQWTLPSSDRYRIEERVRALNALGFSVGELRIASDGETLEIRAVVTDRNYHRDIFHGLTGLLVQENQAQTLMNDIHQFRAQLSREAKRSTSLTGAAHRWFDAIFEPTTEALLGASPHESDGAELYCRLLEHKWYLSERAERDVGLEAALVDFMAEVQDDPASSEP